jgi:hypothetical protein
LHSGGVVVLTTSSRAHAEVALSALRAAGVPAVIRSDDLGGIAPHLALGAHGTRIVVPPEHVDAAREVLGEPEPHVVRERSPLRPGAVLVGVAVAAAVVGLVWRTL